MDSRQGSVKSSSSAAVGGLTPQEFKSLKGKLPGVASAAYTAAPGLEPEAAVETNIVLETDGDDADIEGYNPEEDLEKFNESTELAAREAVLRGLYGTKNPTADVDNIGKPDPNLASPGALKLSKVFDDEGEEMTQAPEGSGDLSYIAVNNAALNKRLTSKDAFASPTAVRTPITQVNKMWSGTEIAAALDAINAEEFDTALHFSGPTVQESPTLSIASTSSTSLRGEKQGSFSDGRKVLNGSKGHSSHSVHAVAPPNGVSSNPPVPPERRGSQTKASK